MFFLVFLAHVAKGHESLWDGEASVCPALIFPLNNFSIIAKLIQPNLVGCICREWGFRFVQIKGLVP